MIEFNKYMDGKSKIVTMSYDDGQVFDKKLINIFDKYKIKGTFHLNSGGIGLESRVTKEDVKTVYKGHEVSLHTISHPFLNRIPSEALINEINEDRKFFEGLTGYIIKGMSYPFGAYNDDTLNKLKALGIVYSRTTKSTNSYNLPADFMKWHPTCHHNDGIEHAKRFISLKNQSYKQPLLYIWGHSYEFDQNNNWNLIEEICKILSEHDEIWYATNMEIYNYVEALNRLIVSADQKLIYNPSYQDVWVSYDKEPVKIPGGNYIKF